MACLIERPDPQVLFDQYKALFENTVLGGATIIPETNEWYAVALNYAMAERFYAISEQAAKERDPRYACCDNLVEMAATDGIYPLAAVPAQGYVEMTGVPTTVLPVPLEFTIGALTYVTAVDDSQPTEICANGSVTVRIRAVVAGAAGNLVETTGTLNTAIADVDAAVVVAGGTFCGGSDTEECETFRQRYINRLQYTPRATNAWITDKLLEWPCATRAVARAGTCCRCDCHESGVGSANGGCEDCGCADCGGKMDFYLMFDGSFTNGIASDAIVKEAEDWLFGSPQGYGLGQVEIGVCGRIVPVTAVPVNITIFVDDCASPVQNTKITELVTDFFTTVEPSKPMRLDLLVSAINRYAPEVYATASASLVNATDATNVYETPCEIEPNCDFLLTLADVTIDSTASSTGGCT